MLVFSAPCGPRLTSDEDLGVMRTTIKQVDFEDLQQRGPGSNVVVRLMMACNDLTLSNQAFKTTRLVDHPYPDDQTARAAGMYFLRVELGHLHEALKIIKSVKNSPPLLKRIGRLDNRSQASYAVLEKYVSGGKEQERLKNLIGVLRNNVGFHYNESGKLIEWAIKDRSSRKTGRNSSIVRSDEGHGWRFRVADDVVDSIVVRKIWKIPREKNMDEEIGKIGQEVNQVLAAFLDFCGEFIWDYCTNRRA